MSDLIDRQTVLKVLDDYEGRHSTVIATAIRALPAPVVVKGFAVFDHVGGVEWGTVLDNEMDSWKRFSVQIDNGYEHWTYTRERYKVADYSCRPVVIIEDKP